ncbi:thioredoxin family protein [Candidatus Peregrinibacteria bacterium CG10_big_fil_rev_8_21_14_0_10_42_8]|nr:MAG: thioredoxin family protein [Candidatus Peregrinibacteria bacterium CG10_big_fil_rev_8_21_14_0_10_42_8]
MVLINDNSSVLAIGDTMPHFSLPATDGLTISSGMIKDPVIAVVFTCNHCPYAMAYEDRLKDMMDKFEKTQFILINSNDADAYPEDSFDRMKVKKEETGWPCEYCYDEDQSVAAAYGALCTPHCFVFDINRELKYKGRIDDNWEHPEGVTEHNLHDAIHALEEGEEPENHEEHAIGCSIKWK